MLDAELIVWTSDGPAHIELGLRINDTNFYQFRLIPLL